MTPFPLRIVTPDGLEFEGQVEELIVRTITGDLGILAGHTNCVAPLGMGRATVIVDGSRRYAACIGGMVSVVNGNVTLVPTTFEWAEDIDLPRANRSYDKAQQVIHDKEASPADIKLAEARLRRALIRKNVASN
jgi:F-type H+-transporting ATPase subunit epsilon